MAFCSWFAWENWGACRFRSFVRILPIRSSEYISALCGFDLLKIIAFVENSSHLTNSTLLVRGQPLLTLVGLAPPGVIALWSGPLTFCEMRVHKIYIPII